MIFCVITFDPAQFISSAYVYWYISEIYSFYVSFQSSIVSALTRIFCFWSVGTMSEKITAEDFLNNIVGLAESSAKQKSVSFFGDDKSDSVSSQISRLFGRQKPIHNLLGGGKCRVILLHYVIWAIFRAIRSCASPIISFFVLFNVWIV